MKREIKYLDVKNGLKTGDLVLFHGKETTSLLIEFIEWSYWSHVGMVVLPKDIGLPGEEPLFFESTASGDGIVDVLLNKPKQSGPMLVPLSQRIHVDVTKGFDNHFKIRYANKTFSDSELLQVKEFICTAHQWQFPTAKEAFKFYETGRHENIDGPENICFCSQLIARLLMKLDYFSSDYVSNGYCPNDFDTFTNIPLTQHLFYTDGARLDG